jgi:hypothetical protein
MRSFAVHNHNGKVNVKADDFLVVKESLVIFRRIGLQHKTRVQEIAAFHLAPGDYVVEEETTK